MAIILKHYIVIWNMYNNEQVMVEFPNSLDFEPVYHNFERSQLSVVSWKLQKLIIIKSSKPGDIFHIDDSHVFEFDLNMLNEQLFAWNYLCSFKSDTINHSQLVKHDKIYLIFLTEQNIYNHIHIGTLHLGDFENRMEIV